MAESMKGLKRSHRCAELSEKNIGEKVVLTGWITTIRDHGGVLFVDLRDHYGVTQVVFSDDKMLGQILPEIDHRRGGRRLLV